jgi:hypothetical protein
LKQSGQKNVEPRKTKKSAGQITPNDTVSKP